MPLKEFVFKTSSRSNLLCQFTRREANSWVLVHLLRGTSQGRAERAIFTIHARPEATTRFLVEEFGKRYGTYEVLMQEGDVASVEVSNYLLPSYRGMDPVEIATSLLGRDAFFAPILIEGGYLHVRVVAAPSSAGKQFAEVLKRITSATSPEDFKLVHTGRYDPLVRLKPRTDQLTPRQEETLRLAIDLGYYDNPRKCTLETLARQFGVSKAAVHKRMVTAESKIIKSYSP